MRTWVSLLRAVNLGRHNQVNMARLRAALAAAGFADVRTYLQSGNVVAGSDHAAADDVARDVADVVRAEFAVDTPVVVRTPAELGDVRAWDPFPADAAARPNLVHVVHLAARPDEDRVAALTALDWSPDGLAVRGREVVVRYAEGSQRSRLQHSGALKRLGVDGTARNWRTLCALVDLAGTEESAPHG